MISKKFSALALVLLLVVMMVGCKDEDPGIVNVCVTPTVIRTSPADAVTNVPLNKISDATESAIAATVKKTSTLAKASGTAGSTTVSTVKVISATFSTPMDPNSITASTFNVWQGTTPVLGAVLYSDTTAIFVVPNGLDPNLTYTCTITTGVKDVTGIALADNYVWSFTTGDAPNITLPRVSSTDPANAATGVPFNQKIAATFSVAMDASTFTSATFILKQGTTSVSGFVSYSGIVAIFAPASPLAPNTGYTATITTKAKDIAGHALANNFIWNFTTGAAAVVTPPTVSSTDPVDAATGVPLNQKIAATFSKTMDASTFTSATFTLKQGTTSVSGFVSYSGVTAIFAPASNLAPSTVYTATITTGATDLAGNALANNFVWSFATGAAVVITPPTVSFTDPLNAATGVPLNQKIAATFSKTMDAITIQTSTFSLRQGITSVSGFVSYSGVTAVFAPASNLAPSTVYTATITTEAKDLAGNAMTNDFVWSFTTGAAVVITPPAVSSTDPLNAALGVPLNQKIAATFSKTMDATTIQTSTFILRRGITPISGFVSYSGVTAIFDPASDLAPNTVYTATITTEAKDLAGNPLANNYAWSFTTGSAAVVIPPVVSSTDPANTETCVALDKRISATFSKTMDPTTIQNSTYILMQGTTQINGFVFYSGTTALFVPASPLTLNTTYTATIKTSATDLAGTPITSNYVWSFTTVIPYTVTLSSNPASGGTTNGSGTFNSCSSVTVAAIPNTGYTFTNWTENGTAVSANANYTFTISGNRTLVANFAAVPQYNVSISRNPSAGGNTYGDGTYMLGSSVTITATANTGYTFTNWTENGNPVSANASYSFNISGDRTFVANFTAIPYTISLSSVPALGGTTNGGGTFNFGSVVTVTASPAVGYVFNNWTESGSPVSSDASYTFTLSGDRTLVANFGLGLAPGAADLGLAATYGLAAYSAITNVPTSFSIINGDASIQINPISSMTGFTFSTPAGAGVVTGNVHAGDAVATQVYNALLAAYNFAKGRTPDVGLFVVGAVDLGTVDIPILPGHVPGRLPPGVYSSAITMNINTNVVLDAGGDANAVWVFQIGSSLTTTSGSVTLTGGAQQKNVFFVPTASATLGTGTTFYGNILAGASVTCNGNNTVFGRLLGGALGAGQIALDGLGSTITVPAP
jgi:hypothetical protein